MTEAQQLAEKLDHLAQEHAVEVSTHRNGRKMGAAERHFEAEGIHAKAHTLEPRPRASVRGSRDVGRATAAGFGSRREPASKESR